MHLSAILQVQLLASSRVSSQILHLRKRAALLEVLQHYLLSLAIVRSKTKQKPSDCECADGRSLMNLSDTAGIFCDANDTAGGDVVVVTGLALLWDA